MRFLRRKRRVKEAGARVASVTPKLLLAAVTDDELTAVDLATGQTKRGWQVYAPPEIVEPTEQGRLSLVLPDRVVALETAKITEAAGATVLEANDDDVFVRMSWLDVSFVECDIMVNALGRTEHFSLARTNDGDFLVRETLRLGSPADLHR